MKLSRIYGFTLLELLIVIVIVGFMLFITYPLMANFIMYSSGGGKNFNRTVKILRYIINKKYSKNKSHPLFIKLDLDKNIIKIYLRKKAALKTFEKLKNYEVSYKNIKLYKVEAAGHIYKRGSVFEEIGANYTSPPFKVYFKSDKRDKRFIINVNTYEDKIATG